MSITISKRKPNYVAINSQGNMSVVFNVHAHQHEGLDELASRHECSRICSFITSFGDKERRDTRKSMGYIFRFKPIFRPKMHPTLEDIESIEMGVDYANRFESEFNAKFR